MRERSGGRRRLSVLALIVGLVLVAVALVTGLGGSTDRPTARAGIDVTKLPSTFQAAAPDSTSGATSRVVTAGRRANRPQPAPVTLALPRPGVRADVLPVVTTDGVLGVPADPADVGWWTGSARPGAPAGSVVIDGHVDSAVNGLGALAVLADVRTDDVVTVTNQAGTTYTYRIYARQVYSKHQPLPAALFATAGPARLVLITCGGRFDEATRSYDFNVVVLASPAP